MKQVYTLFFLILISLHSLAQLSHGGAPQNWEARYQLTAEVLPSPDVSRLIEEDIERDKLSGIPYRFGANLSVDFDINNSGTWTTLENGDRIWELALHSPGAKSLNFVFDAYEVPKGGQVFVYDAEKTGFLGSFTSENRSKEGSLGVGFVFSETLIIQYFEPAEVSGEGYLHINNVTHGYRDIMATVESGDRGPFGNSGACNINVNCPEGLPFDIESSSVALIVVNNNNVCSGAMVNNTAQDGTPYFLTANHCLPFNPDQVANWVFYFNHESPGCTGTTGPTNQSVSGSTLRASNALSDFALLELDQAPPPSFNVCYSGWDATDLESNVSSAFGIHHPSGDIKKICFEEDAPFHDDIGTFVDEVWYINQWELGVTEPGSSGSPLFNQNGLIIGQLAGGTAACSGTVNNGQPDYYGRFGVSWNSSASTSAQLKHWLDPLNSGILLLPNSCDNSSIANDATLGGFLGITDVICNTSPIDLSIEIFNVGNNQLTSAQISVTFNEGVPLIFNWTGSLGFGQGSTVDLGTFFPANGLNSIEAEIITANGQEDLGELGNFKTENFEAIANSVGVLLTIDLDNYPNETTWQITDENGTIIYSGGPYSGGDDPVQEALCLGTECFTFTIFDSANDGLCCGFGEGSYSLVDQFGEVLAEGGEFFGLESTQFCYSLNTENYDPLSGIHVYPNPAENFIRINLGEAISLFDQYRLYDINGRLIRSGFSNGNTEQLIDLNGVQSGLYVLEIQTISGNIQKKVVVNNQ